MPIELAEWGADLIVMPVMALGTCVDIMAFVIKIVDEGLRRVTGRVFGSGFRKN